MLLVGLAVIFVMMFVAFVILVVATRFMPYGRARLLAVSLTAALSIPILLRGHVGLGLAFLAGSVMLTWQLSQRAEESEGSDD